MILLDPPDLSPPNMWKIPYVFLHLLFESFTKVNSPSSQVFVLVFVFLFCWSPYAVLSMAGILGFSTAIPVLITVLPLQMAKSSVLWNPIIYVIMNKQVKVQRKLFCFRFIFKLYLQVNRKGSKIMEGKEVKKIDILDKCHLY